jgi:hypothetical protein
LEGFRFEMHWLQSPEFKTQVQQARAGPVRTSNKAWLLHIELARLAKALRRWNRLKVAHTRREADEAQQQILELDTAQEQRLLTEDEVRVL